MKTRKPLAIAITGIGGMFPGCKNLDEFWQLIAEARTAIDEVHSERWPEDPQSYLDKKIGSPDKVLSTRNAAIKDIPQNYDGLNLSPDLLTGLDPLLQIALQAGRDAFYDAKLEKVDKTRVQVILANIVLPTDTTSELARHINMCQLKSLLSGNKATTSELKSFNPLNRLAAELPATLLAAALGIGGGGYTLDAACASSLYAIKLACEELTAGRADAVLTGGVSRPSSQFTQMGFSQLRALSPSGQCVPFDKVADGLVVGEGAGMFILKRLDDALETGDKIYGVIRGIGLANDVGGSLLAPDVEGQMRAMTMAYDQAGWQPDDIQLVECHGTGTPVGDAVEFSSLKKLWKDLDTDRNCVIGSVKSNVGHLLTGAGAAGLMKLLFSLKNKTLPPVAGFSQPDPALEMDKTRFKVLAKAEPWHPAAEGQPRRCALSAFGFGGIDGHVLIEEYANQAPNKKKIEQLLPVPEIVIVGIETKIGPLVDLHSFQKAVIKGEAVKSAFPATRATAINVENWFQQGAYIDKIEIRPGQFKISPREIPEILPQQLLMLQTVDGALKNQTKQKSDFLNWGVFMGINLDLESTNFASRWGVGVDTAAYELNQFDLDSVKEAVTPPLNHARTVGALGGIVASRIAREYGVGGPSHTFSSGESSGLAALEAATRALQRHEINAAIVGAIDLAGDLRNLLATDMMRPYSRKGASVPFDQSADGSFPGEGAVAFVLKRKEDAIKDGDKIYAIVKGIGRANMTQLNSSDAAIEAYSRAFTNAWDEAGLALENLGMLEAHGSAFPAEDKIEARAISQLIPEKHFSESERFNHDSQRCALTSTKAVVGHTGCVSGLASLAKAAICLHQQMLPATPGLINPVKELLSRKNQLFAPAEPQYWLRNRINGPRTAGVSSMSLDGGFMHVALQGFEEEECLNTEAITAMADSRAFPIGIPEETLFVIGGTNSCDLRDRVTALKNSEASSVQELAREFWHYNTIPEDSAKFVSIVADSIGQLRKRAQYVLHHLNNSPEQPITTSPEVNDRIFYTPRPKALEGKIAFVFPGSGNHFLGMGRELGLYWPEHLNRLDKQHELLAAQFAPEKIMPWRLDWPEDWYEQSMKDLIADHNSLVFSHVSCCALTSDVVRSFGIEPQVIMGYSLGETAGNFATGAWRERDEMVRRMRVSNLFTTELIGQYNSPRSHWGLKPEDKIDWFLGVIHCPAAEVEAEIADFPQAYVLIENTAHECVIGGNRAQVEKIVARLNKTFFPLKGVSSVHCPAALPASDDYRALHLYDCHPPENLQYISSGWGKFFTPERETSADSIKSQCIDRINFPRGVHAAWNEGVRVFLEIGPRYSLSRMINSILADKPHYARSALLYGQNQTSGLLRFLANTAAEGVRVNLAPLFDKRETIQLKADNKLPAIVIRPGNPLEAAKLKKNASFQPAQTAETATAPQADVTIAQAQVEPVMHQPASKAQPEPIMRQPVSQPQRESVMRQPVSQPQSSTFEQNFINQWLEARKSAADAHDVFLRLNNNLMNAQANLTGRTLQMMQGMTPDQIAQALIPAASSAPQPAPSYSTHSAPSATAQPTPGYATQLAPSDAAQPTPGYATQLAPAYATQPPAPKKMPKPYKGPLFLDREGSMEYAIGKIGNSLGEYFAPIDAHPTRVRLPDIPLNFVDRIVLIEGEKGSLGKGRVVSQHDVYPDGWYLDNDCMPTGLAVEAGQADLLLSAWLGIDFKTEGIAKYRLLDAIVTFHGPLPRPGDTINYDIKVDRFIRQADTWLFFFEFDGSIDGKHLITMRKGCAGFFTDKQLDDGRGIVLTEDDTRLEPKPDLPGRENLPAMRVESFEKHSLDAMRNGDLAAAFGPEFADLPIKPQTVPSGAMKMIDRITEIDPKGGRFGLGQIKAEIDIPYDAWFLTSHFCDDQVMPGTMMYESCMQSLRVFLLRLGWVADSSQSAFEPVLEVQSQLRCRGQVVPGTKKALYEISIKELGYNPEPYAIADALMFADGKRIVQVLNMSIRLSGTNREQIEALWQNRKTSAPAVTVNSEMLPAIYTGQQIIEYSIGNPSVCFGDEFKPFDEGRFLARLPNPPFLFVDRITAVNAEFLKIQAGGTVQGQFDLTPDSWFFRANRQTSIAYSILLEFSLQVCGWYSCFMGSAFANDEPMHYRNLDGTATLYEDIDINSGTLTNTVTATRTANSAGMLIQAFDLVVTQGNRKIYECQTSFGFFTKTALANQVGVRGATLYEPSADEISRSTAFTLEPEAPITPEDNTQVSMNGLQLPGKALMMLDEVTCYVEQGGPNQLGFIRGIKKVNPDEWFFKAHFYQDPVIPGSLGLESFLQLLKIVAIKRWGNNSDIGPCHFEPIATGVKHSWSYRGQILPTDDLITTEAVITKIDDVNLLIMGDGFLKVDGRIIYSMKDFAIRLVRDA